MQSSNSNESFESLQGLSSSASCSTPTTFTTSRPMSKRKSADVNDLGADDPKQARPRSYPVSMFGAKKRCCVVSAGGIDWNILSSLLQLFAFLAAILNLKLEKTFEECVVNQLSQPMAMVIGSMLLKQIEVFPSILPPKEHLACYSTWKEKINGLK